MPFLLILELPKQTKNDASVLGKRCPDSLKRLHHPFISHLAWWNLIFQTVGTLARWFVSGSKGTAVEAIRQGPETHHTKPPRNAVPRQNLGMKISTDRGHTPTFPKIDASSNGLCSLFDDTFRKSTKILQKARENSTFDREFGGKKSWHPDCKILTHFFDRAHQLIVRLVISRRHLSAGQPSCRKSFLFWCKPVSLEKTTRNTGLYPFQGHCVLFPERAVPHRTGIFQHRTNIVHIKYWCHWERKVSRHQTEQACSLRRCCQNALCMLWPFEVLR